MASTTNNGDLNLNNTAPWENGSTRLNAKNLNALTKLIFDNNEAILNMPAQYAAADVSLRLNLLAELAGKSSDVSSDNTFCGIKKFIAEKDDEVVNSLTGTADVGSDSLTIRGVKKYAEQQAKALLGTSYDDDNQPTIVGTRKYVDNTKAALQQTLEGQETDERTTLTLNGITNRIEDVENALTNKATDNFRISGFTVSGNIFAGTIDVGTVKTDDIVTSSIKGSEEQSSITFSGESIMFNGNLMFSGQEMTASYNDEEKSVNLSLSKLDDSQKTIKTDLFAHKIVTPYIELTSDQEPTGNMAATVDAVHTIVSNKLTDPNLSAPVQVNQSFSRTDAFPLDSRSVFVC